jgi:Rieske Fe-S protein
MSETTRRAVLAGAAGMGAAAALAACGSNANDTTAGSTDATAGAVPTTGGASPGGAATGGAGNGISTADIPVGGGKVFADQKVVVTQATAGVFKAFSAVCTHTGCTVATVTAGTINCACHGSQFSATDGTVKKGPATKPLAAAKVTVAGGQITLA